MQCVRCVQCGDSAGSATGPARDTDVHTLHPQGHAQWLLSRPHRSGCGVTSQKIEVGDSCYASTPAYLHLAQLGPKRLCGRQGEGEGVEGVLTLLQVEGDLVACQSPGGRGGGHREGCVGGGRKGCVGGCITQPGYS